MTRTIAHEDHDHDYHDDHKDQDDDHDDDNEEHVDWKYLRVPKSTSKYLELLWLLVFCICRGFL